VGSWPVPCAVAALPWIRRLVHALSEEERTAIEPVRGGTLRLLQGGQTSASSDNDAQFFP
jgi:hypothetical protein